MSEKRRPRQDRTYYMYVITNIYTQEQYLGITVKNSGSIFKTLRRRVQKHVQRALAESKDWALCQNIRDWGSEAFTFGFVEQIRGRKPAYQRERELIAQYQPRLNTF
jgi:hypothetical protein